MKSIKVKGKLLQMNFEQCYCQFALLREKFTKSYSKTLPVDADDIKQEVDIAFYNAYKDYSDLNNEFITLAHKYIISHMTNISEYYKRPMRSTSKKNYSLDMDLAEGLLFIETVPVKEGEFENQLLTHMTIKNVFEDMADRRVYAVKKIASGYTYSEVAKQLKISKTSVMKYKYEFIRKYKRMSA